MMTIRQPSAPGHGPGVLRFALPGLLVVLVIAGLLGTVRMPGWTGRYHTDGIAIGVALEVLLVALLVVLMIRDRRVPGGDFLAARLRRALRYLILAGLIAIPIALLLNANLHFKGRKLHIKQPPPYKQRLRPTPTSKPAHGTPVHLGWLPYALLALVVLAAVVVCLVLAARHKTALGGRGPYDVDEEPDEELRAAVESGRSALRSLDDARAAIIACYAAMEDSLARAGTAREVAETPDELLARAVAAGLARGDAAARLTALFYEARFSTHPLDQDQKPAAERALAELAADLDQQPVGDRP
jgi:uncharacterized protein DUF4129